MNKDAALRMAIEALEEADKMSLSEYSRQGDYEKAINACKQALSTTRQEALGETK